MSQNPCPAWALICEIHSYTKYYVFISLSLFGRR